MPFGPPRRVQGPSTLARREAIPTPKSDRRTFEPMGRADRNCGRSQGLSRSRGTILGAALSPDRKWLASAGDETIRLWNLDRAVPTSTHSILPQESRH